MKRSELQNELRKLGFKRMCDDGKTLVAYNQIQYFLTSNKSPIKSIEKIYLDLNGNLRVVIYSDIDLECGYNILED